MSSPKYVDIEVLLSLRSSTESVVELEKLAIVMIESLPKPPVLHLVEKEFKIKATSDKRLVTALFHYFTPDIKT